MSTPAFALIHGAWHGAWCWERVAPLLRERGHHVVAMDLPSEDPEAGLEAYAGTVVAALAEVEGDVVLVGHSQGGLSAPLVAARRPVRGIVYLAALVPQAGASMAGQSAASPERILTIRGRREIDEQGRSYWPDAAETARAMYPDLTAADARWAFERLRRQGPRPWNDRCPAPLPDVPVASIVCTEDRMVNPAWSRRVARERLGVEPLELAGGHCPMLAAPERLAGALIQATSAMPVATSQSDQAT